MELSNSELGSEYFVLRLTAEEMCWFFQDQALI